MYLVEIKESERDTSGNAIHYTHKSSRTKQLERGMVKYAWNDSFKNA